MNSSLKLTPARERAAILLLMQYELNEQLHLADQHAAAGRTAAHNTAATAAEELHRGLERHGSAPDPERTLYSRLSNYHRYRWLLAGRLLLIPTYIEVCTGRRIEDMDELTDDQFVALCADVHTANRDFFQHALPGFAPAAELLDAAAEDGECCPTPSAA